MAAPGIRAPLLALTVTTGLVDAVSYLGLGHVFTANMTGNVVLLGFGIAGSPGLPIVAPIVSLAAFLAGAAAAGLLAPRAAGRREDVFAVGVGAEAVLVGAAAVLAAAAPVRQGSGAAYAVIALLAVAMGLRNAVVRALAIPELSTTVLTGTLTAFAAELGRDLPAGARRAAAVAAILAGGFAGALLVKDSLAAPLAIVAAIDLLAAAYVLTARRGAAAQLQ